MALQQNEDGPVPHPKSKVIVCSTCSLLPDNLTINTGREERFPSAYNKLGKMDKDFKGEFLRCPECKTYYNWIDDSQMYGSGNNDEERLVRFSLKQSRLLDILFTSAPDYRPNSSEVDEYFEALPLYILTDILRMRMYPNPDFIQPFLPQLVTLLITNKDTNNSDELWQILSSYISKGPARAQEILNFFCTGNDFGSTRLTQILHQCLREVKEHQEK